MKAISSVIFSLFIIQSIHAQTFDELIDKGDEFYSAENYAEAAKYFTQAINLDPKQVKGYWYRADAYRQSKEFSEAVKDYTKALEIEPENVKFLTRRGDCYYSLNQYQAAAKDYSKGIELGETTAILWLFRGDCYAKLSETEKACSDYQKAYELGDKSAKGQAKGLECEWVKSLQSKPCPTGEATISKVEIDEFTGAVIVSKGLSFKDLEITTDNGGARVTGPEFAMGETFKFKLTYPINFCMNEDGDVFPGTGFSLADDTGKDLGTVDNIYEEEQAMQQEFLKSMSATLDFRAPMEVGKSYMLKIRFFDTKGNGEVLVEIPFKITPSTQTDSYTLTSQSTLGVGINTASVDIDATALEIRQKGKTELIKSGVFMKNSNYSLTMNISKVPAAGLVVKLRWVDALGKIVLEQPVKSVVTGTKVKIEMNTQNMAAGSYQLWIKMSDPASMQSLGMVMPILVK